jgi:hypothetical protein
MCRAGARRDADVLSESPEKKHPWAKFKARPVAPRPLKGRTAPEALSPKTPLAPPVTPGSEVHATLPVSPAKVVAPAPATVRVTTVPKPVAPEVKRREPAAAPKPAAKAPVVVPPVEVVGGRREEPAVVAKVAAKPAEEPKKPDTPVQAPITAELADSLAQLEGFETAPGWPMALKKSVRPSGQGRLTWIWHGVRDSVRNYRSNFRRLAAWWAHWRTTSSCRVLVAFVVIYGLLAFMRAPSNSTVERSRRQEEISYLQSFLKNYISAGGVVLAQKPHGGSELYPRGVVMKGDLLAAFLRAPVGGVFVVNISGSESNPLAGFYGYPPIYAGGKYFHLERKFNFTLYRCSYLVRKDSDKAGVLLLTRVERAY